jgi:hypothetical protein
MKPPFQPAVATSQLAATHTGPAATIAILMPVEQRQVLTAFCGGGRFLPPFETAA